MRLTPLILGLGFWLSPFCSAAESPLSDPILDQMLLSASFQDVTSGAMLFSKDPDQKLCPASLTKLFTTAAALVDLGPEWAPYTTIGYTGEIKKGVLKGDLVFLGGGDSFLVSEELGRLVRELKQKGLELVEGNLLIDHSLYGHFEDKWRVQDTNSTGAYNAPLSAFAVNFNTVSVAISPGELGQKALMTLDPVPLDNIQLENKTLTVSKGKKSSVTVTRKILDSGKVLLIAEGPVSQESELLHFYRDLPQGETSGYLVKAFLVEAGIKLSGKIRSQNQPVPSMRFFHKFKGRSLDQVLTGINKYSNNFMSDMLLLTLGQINDHSAKNILQQGLGTVRSFLKDTVHIKQDFVLQDGSGLSTQNLFSAKQVTDLLTYMAQQPLIFSYYLLTLPTPGGYGSLKNRFSSPKENEALMVQAKTGTLTAPKVVSNLAGYLYVQKKWVAFAILLNSKTQADAQYVSKGRAFHEKLVQYVYKSQQNRS